jgi:ribosomal protein S6--L-glutamate ligase
MNIALLYHSRAKDDLMHLAARLEKAGHQTMLLDVLRCYMRIASHRPTVRLGARDLDGIDLAVPLFGKGFTFYGAAVLRQFEMAGTPTVNHSLALVRARDRLRSMQLLARKGIGMPMTGFAHRPDDVNDLIQMVGGAPLVVKILHEGQIKATVLAETKKAAEGVVEAFVGLDAQVLIQEYIRPVDGCMRECLVSGGKILGSLKRKVDLQYGTDTHEPWHVTRPGKDEKAFAANTAKALGLELAAVRWFRADRGPLVASVRVVPNLRRYDELIGDACLDKLLAGWLKTASGAGRKSGD